ncbi:adenylyl-sulfate kinase [Butyrivibrio sp. XPD2002]|uniref:adenylyl-sulfate kinase n=1 Tax=Butyrivibrio sp. XPD2002 TaxID=1280665 RepID=UPI000409B629|nr:adenylyl-sulfate kinase [Butyrivibrio sp. XPD2002]
MENTKQKGMVYWITGLAGAGKTTIGSLFYETYHEEHLNSVFFDGDTLRKVFGDDLGYSKEDRKKCAMRYSKLCKLLSDQGINVVICTISMFDSIREWNRENIRNYKEIYIRVPLEILKDRDQKGLYSGSSSEEDTTVAGVDFIFEEPKSPDLILDNDGLKKPTEMVLEILRNI